MFGGEGVETYLSNIFYGWKNRYVVLIQLREVWGFDSGVLPGIQVFWDMPLPRCVGGSVRCEWS